MRNVSSELLSLRDPLRGNTYIYTISYDNLRDLMRVSFSEAMDIL